MHAHSRFLHARPARTAPHRALAFGAHGVGGPARFAVSLRGDDPDAILASGFDFQCLVLR